MKKQLLFARLAEGFPKEELCHRPMKTTSPLQCTVTKQEGIHGTNKKHLYVANLKNAQHSLSAVSMLAALTAHIKWQGHQILPPCNRANNQPTQPSEDVHCTTSDG